MKLQITTFESPKFLRSIVFFVFLQKPNRLKTFKTLRYEQFFLNNINIAIN